VEGGIGFAAAGDAYDEGVFAESTSREPVVDFKPAAEVAHMTELDRTLRRIMWQGDIEALDLAYRESGRLEAREVNHSRQAL